MATTGMGTGSDFSGAEQMLKNVYDESVDVNIEAESELADIFEEAEGFEVKDGSDGKQVIIEHTFSSGDGFVMMNEDDYLPENTNPTAKQSALTIKQSAMLVQLSGRMFRRVTKGPAAFMSWATEVLPRRAARAGFHWDRQLYGSGTGIIGRVDESSPATSDLGIDSAFGISGLTGVTKLLLRDMNLRFSPNANGTSPRSGVAKVVSVDFDNSEINIDNLPSGATDNDYIFQGDANVYGFGSREMMGLEGGIDDGNVLAALQGLTRSTYPEMNGQVVNAATAQSGEFGGTLSEELLDYADSLVWERAGGRVNVIVASRSGHRSFWKAIKGDRVLNDPKGNYTGGKAKLWMTLGDRLVQLKAARKCPDSRAYGLDTSAVKWYRIGKGQWDQTDGSLWKRVTDGTGRKDAFYAVRIREQELGFKDPGKCFKVTTLSAA